MNLHEELAQFCGTDEYYQHSIVPWVVYTDGVKYLMDHGAAWLVNAIASYLPTPEECLRKYGEKFAHFHVWYLTTNMNKEATLEAKADTQDRWVWRQEIDNPDFKFEVRGGCFCPFRLYVAPERVDGRLKYVIMLPSER